MKFCSKCGWRYAKQGQSYCKECHAEYQRAHRKPLDERGRRNSNARSYLHIYVKRGMVKKRPCLICRDVNVEAHHEDYTRPLHVVWLCKSHHQMVTRNDLNILPCYVVDGRMQIEAIDIKYRPESRGDRESVLDYSYGQE